MQFRIPDIGEGVIEAEITELFVSEGQKIAEDDPVFCLMTDKAAVEISAPCSGVVRRIHAQVGDNVAVGSVMLHIDEEEEKATETSGAATSKEEMPDVPVITTQQRPASAPLHQNLAKGKFLASPAVRRKIKARGLDWRNISPTGRHGRILHRDLDAATVISDTLPGQDTPDGTPSSVQSIKISGVRRIIARRLMESKRNAPHFTYIEEIDVTTLEEERSYLRQAFPDKRSPTILSFFALALCRCIPDLPKINAHYHHAEERLKLFKAIHLGIAAATSSGLRVPVIHDAQHLDLWELANRLRDSTERAKANKATRTELSGSTVTITNLGKLGGIASTPILNPPEVAIFGLNAVKERPVYREGTLCKRSIMNLSCSFDHRIIDGMEAAVFVQKLRALLEHPLLIFLDGDASAQVNNAV